MSKRGKVMLGAFLLNGFWMEFWFCRWWDHAGHGPAEADIEHQAVWGMFSSVALAAAIGITWIVLYIRDDLLLEQCGFTYGGDDCHGQKD